ncbi:MMPL family transporter [Paenibacillus contaminans]|uniref:MMPL family transporter n=1 Tax=Paenibacillus contaminans TaxID=450362 RepID=A0A329LKJ0_9BACL|nr:MMPL family transporter [Paenibacillus contaminans]RAV08474.1 MMPL family transporter [Paenibacillus contaminans]
MEKESFLTRYGRLVAGPKSKWVTVVFWIVLTAVLSAVLPGVNQTVNNAAQNLPASMASMQADALARSEFTSDSGLPALVVWYRPSGLVQEDLAAVQKLAKDLEEKPLENQKAVPPLHKLPLPALQAQVSKDGTTLVAPIFFEEETPSEKLKESFAAVEERASAIIGSNPFDSASGLDEQKLHARMTGPAGISVDASALFKKADVSLLLATVLLVLILLILLYRSPILAIVPLIGVGFAYGLVSPLLGALADSGAIEIDSQAVSIMTVLLFGAGTDYCLFIVAKYRQLLLEEQDRYRAMRLALGGSSGAVAMSGLTVVISLFVLMFAKYGVYQRFAAPFSLSILIMGLASLTLVPALLAIFGRVSFYPFVPRTPQMAEELAKRKNKPAKRQQSVGRFSQALGKFVVRRPWQILIVCVLLLGGLAVYSGTTKYTFNTLQSFPEDIPSREGFALISDHFTPGTLAPVKVIVDANGKQTTVKEELAKLPFAVNVTGPVQGSANKQLEAYELEFNVDPYSNEAMDRIPVVRETAAAALQKAGIDGEKVWVGGQTAVQYDTRELNERDEKVVMPIVIGLIALLLVAYLRSIVATFYLIATVVLSYFSALGAGWFILHEVMGASAIQGFIPLYAFVFLVALGEDYNIFMISSIWQKRKFMPLRDAIAQGVSETSSVITSAGLILAGTFAVLATLPIQVLVQFGTVTAIGILLDTFVVRPFLVPAITVLLGKWAFWPGKAVPGAVQDSAGAKYRA